MIYFFADDNNWGYAEDDELPNGMVLSTKETYDEWYEALLNAPRITAYDPPEDL
jgi:hypothetical protein